MNVLDNQSTAVLNFPQMALQVGLALPCLALLSLP
jgi:hypothetical protein